MPATCFQSVLWRRPERSPARWSGWEKPLCVMRYDGRLNDISVSVERFPTCRATVDKDLVSSEVATAPYYSID